jgi:glycosyltransferase involved in cell wall biosynthesis
MKIAVVSLYLPGGSKIGVGYQVHAFANQMVLRGHAVTVFSSCPPGDAPLYECRILKRNGRARTFRFAWDLRSEDFSGFDVLHAHGDDWFLWGKDRPFHVHTYHGACLAEFLHHRNAREKTRMLALAVCEFGSTFLADVRVGVSENTRAYIPRIERVVPNGVDLEGYHPGGTRSERPAILFVGTLRGRKRGGWLREVFEREVRPAVSGAELWMVCEEAVDGEGIRWFGRVSEDLLRELYRRAWVFCLPSTYEGFGIPYIEAMASGTPVVATPNPGAVEVTRGGTCGLVLRDGRLGAGLVRALRDQSLREYLERMGLERVRDFQWARVCSDYEQIYPGSSAARGTGDQNPAGREASLL